MSSSTLSSETNHGRKVHLLRGLVQSRSIMSITYPGLPRPATTAVIDVMPETDTFLMDELVPRNANENIEPNTPIFLQGKLKGVLIEFKALVLRTERDGDLVSHVCAIPGEVVYHQKRREYRLKAPTMPVVSVDLVHEDSTTAGRLIDISVGGSNIELEELPEWAREDTQVICALDLEDGLRIETDAVIRHVFEHSLRSHRVHRLGVQLLSLTADERRKLRQWINVVERRRLKFEQ